MKIVGEGQWATAKHDGKGIRGWRKLHLAVDETGLIVAEKVTDNSVDDASVVPDLLDRVDVAIDRFRADCAYDKWPVYTSVTARGATVVVPPSKTAVESGANTVAARARPPRRCRFRLVGDIPKPRR